MENPSLWLAKYRDASADLFAGALAYIPNLVGAIVLLLVGWLLARFLRAAAIRITNATNRLLDAVLPTGHLSTFRLSSRGASLIGTIVFWLVIFFFVTAASNVARLDALSELLERVVGYLPRLLAGGLIVLVGYLIGAALRDLVSTALSSIGVAQAELIGAMAQWAAFLIAVVVGIEQVGVNTTFLIVVIAIVLGSLLGGMSLAFGLGARPLASNLIGTHYLQRQFTPGQFLKIGDLEGRVLEFAATGIVLETGSGRTTVPGSAYFRHAITVKTAEVHDE